MTKDRSLKPIWQAAVAAAFFVLILANNAINDSQKPTPQQATDNTAVEDTEESRRDCASDGIVTVRSVFAQDGESAFQVAYDSSGFEGRVIYILFAGEIFATPEELTQLAEAAKSDLKANCPTMTEEVPIVLENADWVSVPVGFVSQDMAKIDASAVEAVRKEWQLKSPLAYCAMVLDYSLGRVEASKYGFSSSDATTQESTNRIEIIVRGNGNIEGLSSETVDKITTHCPSPYDFFITHSQ